MSAYEAWKQLDGTDIDSPSRLFIQRAEAGQVIVEAQLLAADGKSRVRVTLDEHDVKALVATEAAMGTTLCEIATHAQRRNILEIAQRRRDAAAAKGEVLKEDGPFTSDELSTGVVPGWASGLGGYNSDMYLPLGNGPYNRQQYLHDMWSMQAKAFWARTHDPVAKAGLEITADFTLGRGYSVVANDPLVQKEWDAFWELNEGDMKLSEWLIDGQTDGNMFHWFFKQGTRPPLVSKPDATTFWEIFTDLENVEKPIMYWQQYQTPYTIFSGPPDPTTGKPLPTYKYVIRQIPADEIIHTKFNASTAEKFGRSDLFAVLGWLKRLRDYYDAETIKAMNQASFAWWFKLTGSQADVTAVQQFQTQNPPPVFNQPGQSYYTNEAVDITALQADKINTNQGGIGIGDGLLSVIALGLRLAKDYFGVTSRGSIGQDPSKTATEPSIKHFESRQKVVRHFLQRCAKKVVEIAQAEGRLPKTVVKQAGVKDIIAALRRGDLIDAFAQLRSVLYGGQEVALDTTVNVVFPPIVREDRAALIKDSEAAEASNLMSKRQRANLVQRAFDMDGYDFDATQDEIAEEMKGETTAVISRNGEQVRKGEPAPWMAAFQPGAVVNPNAPGAAQSGNAQTESAKKFITIDLGE